MTFMAKRFSNGERPLRKNHVTRPVRNHSGRNQVDQGRYGVTIDCRWLGCGELHCGRANVAVEVVERNLIAKRRDVNESLIE